MPLSSNHWTLKHFTERMTVKDWKEILLRGDDKIFVGGRLRKLKVKSLGYGVVEVSKPEEGE